MGDEQHAVAIVGVFVHLRENLLVFAVETAQQHLGGTHVPHAILAFVGKAVERDRAPFART